MEEGKLYIVATPIGNMEDITIRAINTLKNDIDIAYCEDTRQSRKLLNNYGITLPTSSLHSHSSDQKLEHIVETLKEGKNIAYLTDSGTPGISDPGSKLVGKAREGGIEIVPLPGPSALASIVSVSGFPEKKIIFSGFLSKKPGKRINELTALKEFEGIIVVYESPYRIKKLLNAIKEVYPNTEILIGREMTKFYEEFISVNTENIDKTLETLKEKGEFTVALLNRVDKKK
ncbi:MAG: 16S rRNA (cytidine(1402)-2'-O)-methyltransferase [bacterium]|nr:16S rRNA (cytidine(1402)-2'-O)-methyltransferase [bacterium]